MALFGITLYYTGLLMTMPYGNPSRPETGSQVHERGQGRAQRQVQTSSGSLDPDSDLDALIDEALIEERAEQGRGRGRGMGMGHRGGRGPLPANGVTLELNLEHTASASQSALSGEAVVDAHCESDSSVFSNDRVRHRRRRMMTMVAIALNFLFLGALVLVWRSRAAALRKAEELRQFDILTRSLAHEILNPLNAIGLSVQSMERRAGRLEDRDTATFLEARIAIIRQEIDRLNSMVRGFRSLSGNVKTEPTTLSLKDTVKEVEALFSTGLDDAGIRIENRLAPTAKAWADGNLVKQVLINLVKNSMEAISAHRRGNPDASPDEGIIRFSLLDMSAGADQTLVRGLDSRDTEDLVAIVIEDSGPGIEPGRERKIFQPDFTGKTGGFGLGLTICQRLTEAMNGRIFATASPELGGACFLLVLPGPKLSAHK